jgi:hypothetical protein
MSSLVLKPYQMQLKGHNSGIPKTVFVVLCLTVLVPRIGVAGRSVGLDDILSFFMWPVMLTYYMAHKDSLFQGHKLIFGWNLLLLQGIIFGIFGSLLYLGELNLPTEMWQYVKRMTFFYISVYWAWSERISSDYVYKVLFWVLMLAALIGLLQAASWLDVGDAMSRIYARTERQATMLFERSLVNRRIYGVAGFSTAWGGFCVLITSLAISSILTDSWKQGKLKTSNTLLSGLLLSIGLLNLILTGSRAALVGLMFVFIFYTGLQIFSKKHKISNLAKFFSIIAVMCLGIYFYLHERIDYIIYRYNVLLDTIYNGAGRVKQVNDAIGLLDGLYAHIFGVSNATQRQMAASYGTEVEPIYLLVNYGIVGTVLRYSILLIIFIYAYRQWRCSRSVDQILAGAAMSAIVGYAVFSVGYFFFQELYVGAIPWLLFGWVVGKYYRKQEENFNTVFRLKRTVDEKSEGF